MRVQRADRLSDEQAATIRALAERVAADAGAEPLNDQSLSALMSPDVIHLVAQDEGDTVGYAQVDTEHSAELAVDPGTDRDAAAATLLAAAVEAGARLVWVHGAASPVQAALTALGASPDRVLLQLRRPAGPVEPVAVPEGVRLRQFVPGADEDAWLAVNARAFAEHREQGHWTRHDLETREAAEWFDPSGFLLAVDEATDALLGFHWTKIHADESDEVGRSLGEVYVIAVDPTAQGRGLSRVLLAAGLRHLRERGAGDTVLYTDDGNLAARHLYDTAGFAPRRRDVQYRLPA